jgi:hypothetical protein
MAFMQGARSSKDFDLSILSADIDAVYHLQEKPGLQYPGEHFQSVI